MNRQPMSRFAVPVLAALLFAFSGASAGEPVRPAGQPAQPQNMISPAEAFTLLAGEAEKGSPPAMLTLGTMYERGIGVPRNFIKSLEWYRKAANAGLAEGYYNVGVAYEIGMGTTGDPIKAFENFEKSAELGLPQGLYKLSSLYFTGTGTPKNESWGFELLSRAAAAGHLAAANDLGVIHFEGSFGQTKDVNKAFEMFNRAADLGNAEAMKNLAVFFRDGLGRPVDSVQELKWYLLARQAGFPANALEPAIQKVQAGLKPDQIAKAEADAATWMKAFQVRQQASGQVQPPK